MRVEEQLAALEQYLGRPDEGYKSLAYFQLRAVWRAAARRLQQFSDELARQQKDRERKLQLAEFERAQRARVADVDRELVEARVLADQLQAEQRLAEQRLASLKGFWNYFGRRSLLESIESRRFRIDAALTMVTDLTDRRREIESEPPPLFAGLSVDGRRAVNLAVIAYAELLHERLAATGLSDLARQSTLRRVYETSYGGHDECLSLMQRASRGMTDLERMKDDLAAIKARTEHLRRSASYRERGRGHSHPGQPELRRPGAARGILGRLQSARALSGQRRRPHAGRGDRGPCREDAPAPQVQFIEPHVEHRHDQQ